MAEVIRVKRIGCYRLKKTFTNSKIYIIVILSFMYIHFMQAPINSFAQKVHMGTSPFVFPFLLTSSYSAKIFLLLLILLFCDAPFIDEAQIYILMRTGRRRWCAGQHFYIMLMSGLYTIILVFITAVVLFPNISFESGWGKIINTFAQTGIAPSHGIPISFDYTIIMKYSPAEAMLLEGSLCWLLFSLLGNILFFFNLAISRFAGNIAAVFLILFQMIAEEISPVMTYFSPVSWVSLAFLDLNNINQYPGVEYAFGMLCMLNILVILASITAAKYRVTGKEIKL